MTTTGFSPTRSISELAAEEQKHVDAHLELLGDTYELTTRLESLYDSLPQLCRFPMDVATNDAAHAAGINAHLMFMCRRELTVGTLILLRGYRIDFLFHLRKAIELCAFAAKMARHPEKSRTWIQAGESTESWEKFRNNFTKLFPADDQELKNLWDAYDEASEGMHSSIKAVAHYMTDNRRLGSAPEIGIFDIPSDAVFMVCFLRTIDCHLTMLQVFQRILKTYIGINEMSLWSERVMLARIDFTAKYGQWQPLMRTAGKNAPTT